MATPRFPDGPEAAENAAEGKRNTHSTSNLEQARAVGQDAAREGSRQGKEKGKADPGEPGPL